MIKCHQVFTYNSRTEPGVEQVMEISFSRSFILLSQLTAACKLDAEYLSQFGKTFASCVAGVCVAVSAVANVGDKCWLSFSTC